jgi:putative transposase
VYIDLNMVRAGVVSHPRERAHSGYRDIQDTPERYARIDLQELSVLCGFADPGDFRRAHREWIEQALQDDGTLRDDRWSEAIAVGSLAFVESVKSELGSKAIHRAVERIDGAYALREESEAYDGDLCIERLSNLANLA